LGRRFGKILEWLGLDYVEPGPLPIREETPVARKPTHTFRHVKTVDNGQHGTLEILVAVHELSEDRDAIVIRSFWPTQEEVEEFGEVWISTTLLEEVASILEAEQPKQLSLFDQDDA
jgi:hypothetical protein